MANISVNISKDYERAATLLQDIISRNKDTEWEIYGYDPLGRCLEEQQKWKEASKVYQILFSKLQTPQGQVLTEARISELKRRLLLCYGNVGDHSSIIRMYHNFISENPAAASAPEDQFNLALSYLEMDQQKKDTGGRKNQRSKQERGFRRGVERTKSVKRKLQEHDRKCQ